MRDYYPSSAPLGKGRGTFKQFWKPRNTHFFKRKQQNQQQQQQQQQNFQQQQQQNQQQIFQQQQNFQQQNQHQQQQFYEPPRLHELRRENRLKTRKYFQKKKGYAAAAAAAAAGAHAPRNTSSFIMRAKDLGGIASLVSPNPTTPAVLSTPDLSNAPVYKEGISDEVSKEWGVNGYGSMNGFIRLRPWDAGRDGDTSESESEVDQEEHAQSVQQLETKLDHDLNRFEMVYPSANVAGADPNLVETRMEDQESHIAHLEEENLTLKERLYVMEQELEELRRRLSRRHEDADSMDEQAEVCCDSEKSSGPAAAASSLAAVLPAGDTSNN